MLKALIFDVDGTLADTEEAHRMAFNAAFHDAGLDWYWSAALYAELLAVAGGKERLRHYWRQTDPHGPPPPDAVIDHVHALKTRHYTALASALPLRPGVLHLIHEASDAHLPLALATTTTPANIDALLRGPLGSDWRHLFAAIGDGSTAANKKPAPDVYLQVLAALNVPADDCLAIEDSHNGLQAARAAGIPTLVTPGTYTRTQCFDDALLQLEQLGDLAALRRWHAAAFAEGSMT